MSSVRIMVYVSNAEEAVAAIRPIDVSIDVSSLESQLSALSGIVIAVDMSEIQKMAALLSSINVAIDVSAMEQAVAGLKVGVDTARLEQVASEIQSMDMDGIGMSIASIEGKISKISEERASGIKVSSDELGVSSNKAQMEMMMRIAEAIEKVSAASATEQKDRKILIDVQMNGRDMKYKILKDTDVMS